MEQHILFFDIDGTIIDNMNGHQYITKRLKKAFKQLQQNGHLCFIATGRPLAYLNDDILSVGFDGFVLCNGAVIMKDNKVIKEHVFDKEVIKDLVKTLDSNGNAYFLNYLKEVYFSKNGLTKNELFGNEVIKNGIIYRDYDLNQIKVTKVEINQLEDKTRQYLLNMKEKGYEIVFYPHEDYAEITLPHVTKGESILEVLQLLNISKERSIAFGDGNNDIAMLQYVGHGVAMGNATKDLKEVADTITDTCENEGIIKELQRLGLISYDI